MFCGPMASEAPISSSIIVESKPSAVVEVCKEILAKLETHRFGKDDIFAVHLTLEEAFLNAVKHGNKMDPSKKVRIDYSVDSDKVEISVTDEGNGFVPESVADPRFGPGLYEPGGRGLLLMSSYMDTVKYNQRGNSVHMVRYKEKPNLKRGLDETEV